MPARDAVYQRTELGIAEIRHKSHGLTQSERLILILLDGVTPLIDVRLRLQGLTDERFNRAIDKLVKNALAQEVILPVPNFSPDAVDDETAEKFLQQHPLDPVTIISLHPEEELGLPELSDRVVSVRQQGSPRPSPPADVPALQNVFQESPLSLTKSGLIVDATRDEAIVTGMANVEASASPSKRETGAMLDRKAWPTPKCPPSRLDTVNQTTFGWGYWSLVLFASTLTTLALLYL